VGGGDRRGVELRDRLRQPVPAYGDLGVRPGTYPASVEAISGQSQLRATYPMKVLFIGPCLEIL